MLAGSMDERRGSGWLLLFQVILVGVGVLGDNLVVYDGVSGSLRNGFENWSWATVNLQDKQVVRSGDNYAVSLVVQDWKALYVHQSTGFTPGDYPNFQFWVNGGTSGNQPLSISWIQGTQVVGSSLSIQEIIGKPLPANEWVEVQVDLSRFSLGASTSLNGFWIQSGTAGDAGTVYLEDIVLIGGTPPPPSAVTVTLNANSNRHPFSRLIFGVNFASLDQLRKNRYTANRWGGEAVTRYSWDLDTSNHASDWYFENIPNPQPNPKVLPYNSSSDQFINATLLGEATPLITLPTIGFSPFDREKRWGFSVKKYGAQQKTDPWESDAGNGVRTDGSKITGNDYRDTSKVVDSSYALQWLQHISRVFGSQMPVYYELDNEPGLWNSIHRDVHPQPLTYDELWAKTKDYATVIKKNFPHVSVLGPIPWGWCEYFYSPADGCSVGPDYKAHGSVPLLEWYIQQVGAVRSQSGVQLIDIIDFHYYPQEAGVTSSDESPATVALRFNSIRGLYDPTYISQSWINAAPYMIPRIQDWISKYAAGLKLAVSEYNWGGDDILTGALAQVIVLGVFARENVYLATRWGVPTSNSRTEEAFRIYTNYDGHNSYVKGDSVETTSSNEQEVSAFGFVDGSTVYVVFVNKVSSTQIPITIDVSSTKSNGAASLYGFDRTNSLRFIGTRSFSAGKFQYTSPPFSATLAVIN